MKADEILQASSGIIRAMKLTLKQFAAAQAAATRVLFDPVTA